MGIQSTGSNDSANKSRVLLLKSRFDEEEEGDEEELEIITNRCPNIFFCLFSSVQFVLYFM